MCQRYYIKTADTYAKGVSGIAIATNTIISPYSFPVQMRADPVLNIYATGVVNTVYRIDNASTVAATPAQVWWDRNGITGIQANSPFVANQGYSFGIVASAEL